jgi:hypothetical protein
MHRVILHAEKVYGIRQVESRVQHNHRLKEVRNADPDGKIIELAGPDGDPVEKATKRMEEVKPRSTASPIGLELMLAVPKDWAAQHPELIMPWAEKSREWLNRTFQESAIIAATLHLDESAPHIHAIVMPAVDRRLDVRPWTDGAEKLKVMQGSYAQAVQGLGLNRGLEGSTASHEHIREWYSRMNQAIETELPPPHRGEGAMEYRNRIALAWQAAMSRGVETDRLKSRVVELEERNGRLEKTVKSMASELASERNAVRNLTEGLLETGLTRQSIDKIKEMGPEKGKHKGLEL